MKKIFLAMAAAIVLLLGTTSTADALFRLRIEDTSSGIGTADLGELQILVDKTFIPAQISRGTSKDPRELGVRVFHAFVDPR